MKKYRVCSIVFGILLSSMSHAGIVKNVLIGPGLFPTQPSEFIRCMVESSLVGSQLKLLGLTKVNLLASDKSRIEIQFIANDSNGKKGLYTIIANSTEQQNSWQKIDAWVEGSTFYFSKSISSTATVSKVGGTEASVFDFITCQN